jgi:Tfp pilus assembly protein FimT
MSTSTETEDRSYRTMLYIGAAVVIAILMIIGLITFSSARSTQQAEEKADQLIAALQSEGARAPSKDQIVRVLGDDGGATCTDPNEALSRGTFLSLLVNGAAGPGIRPIVADRKIVRGQLLIIKIYCPDELEDFQNFVDKLKTSDVAG